MTIFTASQENTILEKPEEVGGEIAHVLPQPYNPF